ncbi:MAG: PQQ-binding-like beta-propeller repeat protein [Phycisphaerae bacterium]|nr:PQQ-binding-like beta-propeller repeat protein [Phycisphaerae bacterium]
MSSAQSPHSVRPARLDPPRGRPSARSRLGLLAGSALLTTVNLALAAAPAPTDWPAFRGPRGDGISNCPSRLANPSPIELREAWKVKIGSGYAGIAVAGGQLATGFSDGKNDVLAMFDAKSGREQWRLTLGPTYEGHDGSHTGPIATPIIADGRVIMLGAFGELVAADASTGKELWRVDIVKEYQARPPRYGFGASPLLMDGTLIVAVGAEGALAIGLDPASGKLRWKCGSDTVQFQSPLAVEWEKQQRLLLPGDGRFVLADAATGKPIWERALPQRIFTPVVVWGDRALLSDREESKVVSLTQETKLDPPASAPASAPAMPATKTALLWQDRSLRNSYNVPIYLDGHLYAYTTRFLTCVSADDGSVKWRSRDPGDGFLVVCDNHLVVVTKEGSLHVAPVTPKEYVERASIKLFNDLVWTHPSFADGSIYVRSLGELARVDIADAGAAPVAAKHGDATAGGFAGLLARLEGAADKTALIDEFMATVKEFPLIEGRDTVHFLFRGEAKDVAVASDLFGARQEKAMTHVPGTDLFYCTAKLEPTARLNYCFIKDYQESQDPRNPRQTMSFVVGRDMEMSFGRGGGLPMNWFAMPEWKAPAFLRDLPEAQRGKIEPRELQAKGFATPIKMSVYLPTAYTADSAKRFPTAYIQNGRGAIDIAQWPKALDALIADGRIPPIVAVFLEMPQGPRDDPEAGEKALADIVVPFVDANFRTIAQRDARASIGMGLGGLNALASAFQAPATFGLIGVQSPMLFDGARQGLIAAAPEASAHRLRYYQEWGKYDLRNPHENWDMAAFNRDFAKKMQEKGHTVLGQEVIDGTDWESWKNRTDRVLIALFGEPKVQ